MYIAAARRATGWIWLLGPLLLLVWHFWLSIQNEFISVAYYAVAWGSLLVLALCGFWFLIGGPGAKWILRIAAVLVALYVGLLLVITSGNAPFYGGHDYVGYTFMTLGVAFCVFTILISGRHAT